MSRNLTLTIAILVLILVGGWLLLRNQKSTNVVAPQTLTSPSPIASSSVSASPSSQENLVTIQSSGFSPKDVTIKVGQTVTWKNADTVDHTVNSAVHPTHLVYPPLNLGTIKPGESRSLNFPTAGTYKYHDHLNPSLTGSVTVQ